LLRALRLLGSLWLLLSGLLGPLLLTVRPLFLRLLRALLPLRLWLSLLGPLPLPLRPLLLRLCLLLLRLLGRLLLRLPSLLVSFLLLRLLRVLLLLPAFFFVLLFVLGVRRDNRREKQNQGSRTRSNESHGNCLRLKRHRGLCTQPTSTR
jgi:hypothetical protein